MMAAAIYSARQMGVKENFHVWSDTPIPGAITHHSGQFDKSHYKFKLDFLHRQVKGLFYEYFVFVDADSWFVRNPGDIINYCQDSPVHICMESNCDNPDAYRKDWWGCPLEEYCRLMRAKGVRCKQIFNMNAGLWIVHRDAIDKLYRLAYEFWHFAQQSGYTFTEEAPLAFVGHMMMGNPYKHQLRMAPELWASDWLGHFKDRIPVDEAWDFHDYMTDELIRVQPAIVHAMGSKDKLIQIGNGLT
jgi:hypothetical protein